MQYACIKYDAVRTFVRHVQTVLPDNTINVNYVVGIGTSIHKLCDRYPIIFCPFQTKILQIVQLYLFKVVQLRR